ncbi:MAG: hypothetical protein GF330_09265 [Candidatus Eisenbacteria bacterium]|nr:hypothetical protein [Candidatus Eisenbacteria bacterium]
MRRTNSLAALLLLLAAPIAADQSCVQLGPGTGLCSEIQGDLPREDLVYWESCDGTFENAYCWDILVLEEPYYGGFAEGFGGPAEVAGMRIYLTSMEGTASDDVDLYVWTAGIPGPGAVVAVVPAVVESIPVWPDVVAYDFDISADVGNRFYVGIWDDPEQGGCPWSWFIAADQNGPLGSPWTCIGPDWGYPTGWQDPSIVWGSTNSMGLGVYVRGAAGIGDHPGDRPAPHAPTWGQIKTVFS